MRETFPSSVQCWQLLSKKNTTLKVARWHLRLIYVISSLHIMEVVCGESMRDKNNSLNMFRLTNEFVPIDPCFISCHNLIKTIDNLRKKRTAHTQIKNDEQTALFKIAS